MVLAPLERYFALASRFAVKLYAVAYPAVLQPNAPTCLSQLSTPPPILPTHYFFLLKCMQMSY